MTNPKSEPDGTRSETIAVEKRLLDENDRLAESSRQRFRANGVCVLNLISSPGSGKTTLLVETLRALKPFYRMAVIEGDQQTDYDAQRIAEVDVPVVQVNTGSACHLDARMISDAVDRLSATSPQLFFIENVGNLICPAEFDLGETAKVAIMSVTEGEEKPLKYPLIFHLAQALVVTKTDLLPYLPFDLPRFLANAHRVNPSLTILQTSALHADTLTGWLDWLHGMVRASQADSPQKSK